MPDNKIYDRDCRDCPRLARFLDEVGARHPDYWCRPVPPFGDSAARLVIVGLAPGMHGANRTGRPFTGDYAGILLYRTLHRYGFATAPESIDASDGLRLLDCRITNAVKCLPPDNKPEGAEVAACNRYLAVELGGSGGIEVVVALGGIAHRAVLKAIRAKQSAFPFAHGAVHVPGDFSLVDSYHCSRYNTNTGRLTETMFDDVFATARRLLD